MCFPVQFGKQIPLNLATDFVITSNYYWRNEETPVSIFSITFTFHFIFWTLALGANENFYLIHVLWIAITHGSQIKLCWFRINLGNSFEWICYCLFFSSFHFILNFCTIYACHSLSLFKQIHLMSHHRLFLYCIFVYNALDEVCHCKEKKRCELIFEIFSPEWTIFCYLNHSNIPYELNL